MGDRPQSCRLVGADEPNRGIGSKEVKGGGGYGLFSTLFDQRFFS